LYAAVVHYALSIKMIADFVPARREQNADCPSAGSEPEFAAADQGANSHDRINQA
jgi:hypothetical protein